MKGIWEQKKKDIKPRQERYTFFINSLFTFNSLNNYKTNSLQAFIYNIVACEIHGTMHMY